MKKTSGPAVIAALLAFNGGFVDTASFLGLEGLFTSHVTGNFVTLGAALVSGSHGILNKLLALPVFVVSIALARMAAAYLRARDLPVLTSLLLAEVVLLALFCGLAVTYGPFPNADTPLALLTGFAGVAAMAVQNGFQRVHFAELPPTTIMTGNTTQATIDAVDLLRGVPRKQRKAIAARFRRLAASILYFAAGCAASAALFWQIGFWCLIVAVAVAAAAAMVRAATE